MGTKKPEIASGFLIFFLNLPYSAAGASSVAGASEILQ
jgi:hypothetical protein